MKQEEWNNVSIAVIGLGYVGMPLALRLSRYFKTTGYDLNVKRVEELQQGWDSNREIRQSELRASTCAFTSDLRDIAQAQIYIITVPTPITKTNEPDLTAMRKASEAVGSYLEEGNIVVYESTVYPGVTEDICGPILENQSGLKSGSGFFLGYSPERINPGDTQHTVENITKVVSGQTPETTALLSYIYGKVTNNNIFVAKDIKTAEASKVIENAQRDINVAFINEVAMILNKMDISAYDVLEAAGTKWNFLNFVPGLVGGHCISVDPFYLARCAQNIGHEPKAILAGREINDNMGVFIADHIHHSLLKAQKSKVLILGFTFKENINDIRNTKVIDVVRQLKSHGHQIDIHDPYAQLEEVQEEYNLEIQQSLPVDDAYDCVALMVAHDIYTDLNVASVQRLLHTQDAKIFDIKGIWRDLEFPDHIVYKSL